MTLRSKTALLISSLALTIALPTAAQMPDHDGHKMPGHDMAAMDHDHNAHRVEALATVTAILPDENRISLSHGAIPEMSWPAATMKFPVSSGIDVSMFKPGDRVQFTLQRTKTGSLPIIALCLTEATDVQSGLCTKPGMMANHGMSAMKDGAAMPGMMGKGNMDHGSMEHGAMDHGAMDHGTMDHGQMAKRSVTTSGTVLRIDEATRGLRIKHAPIPEIGWPVMSMQFEVEDEVDLTGLSEGDAISFDFDPDTEDGYVISALRRTDNTRATEKLATEKPATGDHSKHKGH